MSGKVLPFDSTVHHPAQLLLPWYVNGTLDAAEIADVRAHLEQCLHCRNEMQSLQSFETAYAESEPVSDPEPSLARLHATIAAESSPPQPRSPAQSRPPSSLPQQPAWRFLPSIERLLPWAALAGVGVLASVLVLPAGMLDLSPRYRTLGAASTSTPEVARMAVVFDPDLSEGRMRSIVQAVGARIVDGPTSARAYVLETPRAAQRDALSALRSATGVQIAEPLDFAP